jgi:primosomal protein N' (replication factor Y)
MRSRATSRISASCPVIEDQDRVRDRIILKGKDLDEMRQAVQYFIDHTDADLKGLRIDVNPMVLD